MKKRDNIAKALDSLFYRIALKPWAFIYLHFDDMIVRHLGSGSSDDAAPERRQQFPKTQNRNRSEAKDRGIEL